MSSGLNRLEHQPDPTIEPRLESSPAGVRPYFHRVESLRGLGAMAVAAYHISGSDVHGVQLLPHDPWSGVGGFQNALGRLSIKLLPGHAAVTAFFVISGFVLRLSLEHGPQKATSAAGKFLLGRIFRVYPIIIVSILLLGLLGFMQLAPPTTDGLPTTVPRFFANLLLLDVSMNGSLWAIQLELIVAPVLLGLYFLERRRGPSALIGIALVGTALSFSSRWALWMPLSHYLYTFVLGMLIPTLGRRHATSLSRQAAYRSALGAVAVLFLTHPCIGLYSPFSTLFEAYASLVLVSLLAYRPDVPLFRFLDFVPLRRLGVSSGSYYVLHMATVPATIMLAASCVPAKWSAGVPTLVGFLVIALWLAVLVPLALAGYQFIERPGIAVGRRIIGRCGLNARTHRRPSTPGTVEQLAA